MLFDHERDIRFGCVGVAQHGPEGSHRNASTLPDGVVDQGPRHRHVALPGQPALVLDVAHNPHSIAALAANLDAMSFYPTTHGVFGAMADKDLAAMLATMDPVVDRWYFSDLPTPRAETAAGLLAKWQAATTRKDVEASTHAGPVAALAAAMAAAGPADRIVIFGSFYTVGGILKDGLPRLQAKHL